MPDNNPKPNPRPSLLRQLFSIAPAVTKSFVQLPMIPLKQAAKSVNMRINENLAENLEPYGYGGSVLGDGGIIDKINFGVGTANKYIKAGILDIKDPSRTRIEGNPSNQDMLRMDLLNLYAGKPQKYNSVTKSQYAPSTSKDKNKTYFASTEAEDDLLSRVLDSESLSKLSKGIKSKKDLELALSGAGKKSDIGYQATISGLGKATFDFGEDEKGPYMSYYDKWDLNPLAGKSSAIGLGKSADDFVVGLTEALGATPPELYGRIYFDKKTGRPIDPKHQKVFDKAVSNIKEAEAFNAAQSTSTGKPATSGFSGLMKKQKKK